MEKFHLMQIIFEGSFFKKSKIFEKYKKKENVFFLFLLYELPERESG